MLIKLDLQTIIHSEQVALVRHLLEKTPLPDAEGKHTKYRCHPVTRIWMKNSLNLVKFNDFRADFEYWDEEALRVWRLLCHACRQKEQFP